MFIEEMEITDDNKFWLVTLTCTQQLTQPLNPIEAMTGPKYARFSKEVKMDVQTGQVRSIKNKKL